MIILNPWEEKCLRLLAFIGMILTVASEACEDPNEDL
jgi:hypothetical protein